MDRRIFLSSLGAGAFAAAVTVAAPASASVVAATSQRAATRVLVATSEPWGTYHIENLLDEAEIAGREIALVVPDRSQIAPGDPVPTVTLDEAAGWGADLLVVNSANDWPTRVAASLPDLPVAASSLAYLTPVEAPGAAALRPRLVAMTAGAGGEAEVFAAHFGVPASRVKVVGNPALDGLPRHQPKPGSVLIATSVTKDDETGDAAPGSALLLEVAHALADAGAHVRVGLHPREDPSIWSRFEAAPEGTIEASTRAEVCIGIPGSVFPSIAAIGCPLVGIVVPGLETPPYILALCARAGSLRSAVTAAHAGWRPGATDMRRAIGPVGGSGERLWLAFEDAVRRGPIIDTGVDGDRPGATGGAMDGSLLPAVAGTGLVAAGAVVLARRGILREM